MLRRAAATTTATNILTPRNRNIFYTTAAASTATITTFNKGPKYMVTACDNLTYRYTATHTLLLDCHWAFQTLVTESSPADKTSCPYTVNERYFHIHTYIYIHTYSTDDCDRQERASVTRDKEMSEVLQRTAAHILMNTIHTAR